jgi:hypothetical protein
MTYTVSQLVNRAAKRLRIVPGGDTMEAEDAADALEAYNSMMFGFAAAGLTLTDPAGDDYTHTTQTLASTFPLDDKYYDSVWTLLMERMIGQFPVDQSVAQGVGPDIRNAMDRMYAAFMVIGEASVAGAGPLPSQTDKSWG